MGNIRMFPLNMFDGLYPFPDPYTLPGVTPGRG